MRPDLPTGTVTFLFTDVEGSTKLLHDLGAEAYADALAGHRRIVREAFTAHGGVEVDTQGDAFFVAFPTTEGALAAANAARDALTEGPIRVRMGIHTGISHVDDEGYVGADVHRAARIAAAGHGGQVLVSAATVALVGTAGLRDLGEHRLKDFAEPVALYQLGDERFPPLRTISNTNLPRPASSFVGRGREVDEIAALLQGGARLVTLTAPGGSGKTRLAIEAAATLVPEFKAGVFWIGLAALRDPTLVMSEIERIVGAKQSLTAHIGEREMLLLLDNLEQVIATAPDLATLVEACPNLRLLVTSRERLRVRGEREYAVPPLTEQEAMTLFCERTDLPPDETIAELCRRLDELPLAVELAAARASVLSPAQILERLSKRLDLLKGGRDADPRQYTLRATIEWSHDLLTPEEQTLFARLSVFRGGSTLEAAEVVVDADVDALQSLVDKNLLRHSDERFGTLETIREYAAERLVGSDEEILTRDRHLDHFLALAERASGERFASPFMWHAIIDLEHDNIRAALDWARITRPPVEAQLIGAVAFYWYERGHARETRERLSDVLAAYPSRDSIRARALTLLGQDLDEPGKALACLGEALEIWRERADVHGEAWALESIGSMHITFGQYAPARIALEESLAVLRQAGAPEVEGLRALSQLCHLLVATGDTAGAEPMARRLYDLGAKYEARRAQELGLHFLADCALLGGAYVDAEVRYRRALGFARDWGLVIRLMDELRGVAMAAAGQGNHARAVRLAAAANAQDEALGFALGDNWWTQIQERHIGGARAQLESDELEAAERAGREAPFDAVLDQVIGPQAAPVAS